MRPLALSTLVVLAACRPDGATAESKPEGTKSTTGSASGRDGEPAEKSPEEVLVTPSAKVVQIEGQTFLAVDFELAEGWHVYWHNPGDSGLATKVKASSAGSELGRTLYPAPERFESPGGLTSYGYEHSATLFVPLEAAPSGAIEVEAKWLACRERCVRGQKQVQAPPTPVDASERHVEAFARLPKAMSDLPGEATWEGNALVLATREGAVADFFPASTDPAMLEKVDLAERSARLTYSRTDGGERTQGVIAVRHDDETSFYRVEAPWPTTP